MPYRPCSRCGKNPANRNHTQCSQCRYEVRKGLAEAPAPAVKAEFLVDTEMRLDETVSPSEVVWFTGARSIWPPGLLAKYALEPIDGKRGWYRILVRVTRGKEQA